MTFSELGLIAPILKALEQQGYRSPSPIQAKAIPPALAGRDVLGCAQTGTGKTCAFATPILQQLNGQNQGGRTIRSLLLTPTRELAIQIGESFAAYGKHLPLRTASETGWVKNDPLIFFAAPFFSGDKFHSIITNPADVIFCFRIQELIPLCPFNNPFGRIQMGHICTALCHRNGRTAGICK